MARPVVATRRKKDTDTLPADRIDEIKVSARQGTNWAMEVGYGPACRCGIYKNGITTDDGICYQHPERGVAPTRAQAHARRREDATG